MKASSVQSHDEDPSSLIDAKIAAVPDWRGPVLARMRALIRAADPEITEAVKWRKPTNPAGVPVWERAGLICTGELYKDKVKLTFAHGAKLDDPHGLLNRSTGGGTIRAIDIPADHEIEAKAFTALVRTAVKFNLDRKAANTTT